MNLNTNTNYVTFDISEPERIKILDSDGEFIDYFVNNDIGKLLAEQLAEEIRACNTDTEIALAVYSYVDASSLIINPIASWLQRMIETYENSDYVNRIGSNYIIMDEH